MRKILFAILAFCGFCACEDDDVLFDASVPNETITFEPISGGAIMRYNMPKDTEIRTICARYTNERGEEMMIRGTLFADSITLTGFNAPRTNVPVSVTVADKNNVESAPVELTFSTLPSAPFAYIDSVEVYASWGGFFIESSYSGSTSGMLDVYRVGPNPFSGETDTLFVDDFPITAGQSKNVISLDTDEEETTLVLKTADSKGNHIRTKVIPGLRQYKMELYPGEKLAMSDPGGFSEEWQGESDAPHDYCTMFGVEFLNDGDKTGVRRIESGGEWYDRMYTYRTIAQPTNPYVQVELEEAHVIAVIRLYGMIKNNALMSYSDFFGGYVSDFLPCHVKVFGSNDASLPMEDWVEIADMEWPRDAQAVSCWGLHDVVNTLRPDDYKSITPYYGEVACDFEGAAYKYIRVMTLDHFQTNTESALLYGNVDNRISYHELEVYVKAE